MMASGGREMKSKKKLEEARKNGQAPAELDEEGKEINPHIPQYIAQAPWYLSQNKPSLKHQRISIDKDGASDGWYLRGAIAAPAATKFRKGACANCGAMTHAAKFCTERPRRIGAKWNGRDIKADEVISQIDLDWDGKRDRWNGYDPSTHSVVVDQFEKIEQERRKMKKEEEMKKFMTEPDANQQKFPSVKDNNSKEPSKLVDDESSDDSDEVANEDDFKASEEGSLEVKKDPKTRTTVRNLRIREDTAKYLRNLSIDSAYYDPKSRSMRDNPNPDVNAEESLYAGDNFVRKSGDVQKFYEAQKFAWQADMTGAPIHLQGAPSASELLHKKHNTEVEESSKKLKEELLAKYGGQEYLASKETKMLAQTEEYIEYTPQGIRKTNEKGIIRSKYEEDIYPGNHSSVWGSFWANGRWGYACCRQFVKQSYCTGKSGIAAQEEIKKDMERKSTVVKEEAKDTNSPPSKKKDSKDSKRGYDAFQYSTGTDEKEIEEYRQKKLRSDDPMKDFVKSS